MNCRRLAAFRWTFRGLALLIFLPIFFPDTLLRRIGEAWIVEHPIQKADAIVVLGGGVPFRPIDAAELYRQGLGERVLISAAPNRFELESKRLETIDFSVPQHGTSFQLLRQHGVPASAIIVLPEASTSTREEAERVAKWTGKHGVGRLLIPTNQFHTRRVAWTFEKHSGCDCTVVATRFRRPECWWESRDEVRSFQNELIKMLVYKILY